MGGEAEGVEVACREGEEGGRILSFGAEFRLPRQQVVAQVVTLSAKVASRWSRWAGALFFASWASAFREVGLVKASGRDSVTVVSSI